MRAVYVDAPEGFAIEGVTTRQRLAKGTELVPLLRRRPLARRLWTNPANRTKALVRKLRIRHGCKPGVKPCVKH
jgi:hypothetical protein